MEWSDPIGDPNSLKLQPPRPALISIKADQALWRRAVNVAHGSAPAHGLMVVCPLMPIKPLGCIS
ncbi:MAG: hypothetical protein BGO16_04920 [Nitrobacter sp. 62-23]|nr:MAG: hypothetical protein BGO16_04920 [Nitrobacter sp. 62-23]